MPYDASEANTYIDNYLAHYGRKGMKWGVRRTDAELAGSAFSRLPRPTPEQAAAFKKGAARVAINVGKVGVVPAALALGAAAPVALGLGATVRVLSDPAVKEAVGYARDYSKLALNEMGVLKMSKIDASKALINVKTVRFKDGLRDMAENQKLIRENPNIYSITDTGGPLFGGKSISSNSGYDNRVSGVKFKRES